MTDIEHALNSAKCTEDMVDEGSRTGDNASSGAEKIFITNSPISELVWSQHKGLSIKYAASSLAEKKASVLWNTESFNIIISSPQCNNVGERSNTGGFITGAMNSLQLNPNPEYCDYNSATLLGSPKSSSLGVQPISSLRIHEQDRGSFGDKELLNRKGKTILDHNQEHYQPDKKEVDVCSSINQFQMVENRPELVGCHTNHEKPSMSGLDNSGPAADSLLCNLKVLRQDLAPEEAHCTTYGGASTNNPRGFGRMKNYQESSLAKVAYEVNMLAKHESPVESASGSKSTESRHADLAVALEDNADNRMTHHLTSLHPLGKQWLGDVQSLDLRGRTEVGTRVVLQSTDKAQDGIYHASYKDNSSAIWCQSDCNVKSSNRRKSKEIILHDAGDSCSISKDREDSHESVEISSSRRLVLTGKRASSPDLTNSRECKMFKKQRNEKGSSGSSVRQGSSFINWISAITNGYIGSDQAKPLSFVPQSTTERNLSSHPKPNGTVGFKSIFQTLYCSSSRVQSISSGGLDLLRTDDALKEHKVAGRQFIHGSSHMVCDNVEFNSCNMISATNEKMNNGSEGHVSSGSARLTPDGNNVKLHNRVLTLSEKLNQVTCHVEGIPSTTINISSTNSRFHERTNYKIGNTYNMGDMGSPSSSPKLASGPHSEDKGTGLFVAAPSSSSNPVTDRNFLESPWITRLSSKVSTARANASPCDQGMELPSKRLANTCNMLHPNDVASNRGPSSSVSCQLPSLQCLKDAACGEKHECTIFPITPCCSKRMGDQKLESNINTISPSQRSRKSGEMASVFAKRLDAFRHLAPSEVSRNATSSTTTCFFCGKSGHSIRECSEIGDSDLDILLKNMDPCDGTDKSSCLCIRCFQLNHWAISCPYTSSKRKHIIDHPFIFGYENCNGMKNERGDLSFANHDGRTTFSAVAKQEQHQLVSEHKIPCSGNVRATIEPVVNSNVSSGMERVVALNTKNLCSNLVKKDIGESTAKLNMACSSSGENESKENQNIPFYKFVRTELTDESVGIFETIRQLRLSRTDIIRWMKSPVSHLSLEGFFLRLRLGKWEKDIVGTGYHVACINGANGENCLSVCIGGFIYLIDSRSVSNQDFVEDELKAWWFETLKGGGKLPTIEELNNKLGERIKLGF